MSLRENRADLSAEELDYLRGLFVDSEAGGADAQAVPARAALDALPAWLRGGRARLSVARGEYRLEFDAEPEGDAAAGCGWRLARPQVIDCRGRERSARQSGPVGIVLEDTLGRFDESRLRDISTQGAALEVRVRCPLQDSLRVGQDLSGLRLEIQGQGRWLVAAQLARLQPSPAHAVPELLLGLRFRHLPDDADQALRSRLLETGQRAYGLD